MRTGEPLLIICYTFPPYRGIGGRRWAKFAKALAKRGHTVHVIHSSGGHDLEGSLWSDDIKDPGIITHPLPRRYPAVLSKRPLTTLREKIEYRLWSRLLPLCAKGNWYDKAVFWEKQLLMECGALIHTHGIRKVIVSGAPFRLMTYAAKLKERFPDLCMVADFRDPWTWGRHYGQGSLSTARLEHEQKQEQMVARVFDRLISPAPAIIEHLRKTYGGDPSRYVCIAHAIDPDELDTAARPASDGIHRMIYAGSLYGAEEAEVYFEELLKAFEGLRASRPDVFTKCVLDLYITGHGTESYVAKVKAGGLSERIRFHTPLPPKEIFRRIAAADLVLIFIPSMNKDFLGTKFTEIFYLRKPVLHIGVPGFVSRSIISRKLGTSVRVEELALELPRIIRGERPIDIDPAVDLSEHVLGTITEKLVRVVLA